MKKDFIHNRKKLKIAILLDEIKNNKGLAIVMHGLGGFKEQAHLQAMTEAFLENNYTVLRFDTTNTLGESDGDYADATVTNYYEDLEDVIKFAKQQSWYKEPFILAGHSLGGICTALYAENHPKEVKALAPISTVVSGKLSIESKEQKGELEEWKRTGWRIKLSHSKPGMIKRLKWSHMKDRLKYDLLLKANQLTMPVLLIVGDSDNSTLPEHQQLLYSKLPSKKEIYIIKNAPHTFKDPKHLEEIKGIFNNWIKNNL